MKQSSGCWFKGKNYTVTGLNIFYRKLSFLIVLFIIVFVPVSPVHGISAPYPVFGYVFDSSGTPVANLSINITDISTGAHGIAITNAGGKYTIDLSVFKEYSDGDLIEAAASVNCSSYGSYSASAYGKVDTEEGSTEIDLSFNRSFSTLSGNIMYSNGLIPAAFHIDLMDGSRDYEFSGDISVSDDGYRVPLCIIPNLGVGDYVEVQAFSGNFSTKISFTFYGQSTVLNMTLEDTVPPSIYSVTPSCGMNVSMENEVLIYASVKDDSPLSNVSLCYSINNRYFLEESMQSESDCGRDWNANGRLDSDVFGAAVGPANLPGKLRYYIYAEDAYSNAARMPEAGTCVLNLVDTVLPNIYVSPPSFIQAGAEMNLSARVKDDFLVDSVYLSYNDTSGNFFNRTMESLGNGTFLCSILGQAVGVFNFSVSAYDSSNWNSTELYSIPVVDTLPPVIRSHPLNSMNAGESARVVATITDVSGVYNATLYYMGVEDTSFTGITMSANGNNFTAVIPAQPSTGNLQYYITCDDGTNMARFPEFGNITVPVFDAGTPFITSSPPAPVDIGSVLRINAEISDDIGVSSSTLYYNLSGSSVVHAVSMSMISGDAMDGIWGAVLPAQDSPVIIWYTIEATDGTNNITYPYNSLQSVAVKDLSAPHLFSVDVPANVNISELCSISVSVEDNYRVDSVSLVEVSDNGTWFTHRHMGLRTGDLANGTWSIPMSFDSTGEISFFFKVSDGTHIIRYPTDGLLSLMVVDQTPPVIGDFLARPQTHPVPAVPGDRILIEAYISDNVRVQSAVLSYIEDGEVRNISMIYEGSNVFSALSGKVSAPGFFQYSISASDGFNTVRLPSQGWETVEVKDNSPPVIIYDVPSFLEAGTSAFIHGSVVDDFNVSFLFAEYRFVPDEGQAAPWMKVPVIMSPPVLSGSGVFRDFCLRLEPFFLPGTIEFNMSASDGSNTVYSPAGFSVSIKVKDTTPPQISVEPAAVVHAGNESRVYVHASDLSGILSVKLMSSSGRTYVGEYLGSSPSGNGTYLFRIKSDSDVLYTISATDGAYNTGQSPDSGYYLLRFKSHPDLQPVQPSDNSPQSVVINLFSILLFAAQAIALALFVLHRKLI